MTRRKKQHARLKNRIDRASVEREGRRGMLHRRHQRFGGDHRQQRHR